MHVKFSIGKTELQNALSVVVKGISQTSTQAVLYGILIDAGEDSITLHSTNLELSIKCTLPALVDEPGRTVVPGKMFSEYVKSLPDAAIHIKASDNEANINCDVASFSMKTLESLTFPAFPEVDASQTVKIPFERFSSMVKKVARATARDETHAALTGILVSFSDGALRLVAADGYRLAFTETEIGMGAYSGSADDATPFEAVINTSFLLDIASMKDSEEPVSIGLAENQIIVSYNNVTLINRKIEAKFPPYQQLLPTGFRTRAKFDLAELASSVKRVSLLSNTTTMKSFMGIDINVGAQVATFTVTSTDVGTSQETLDAQVEGEDIRISFDPDFVKDGLGGMKGESVYLDIRVIDERNNHVGGFFWMDDVENYTYLVLPKRG